MKVNFKKLNFSIISIVWFLMGLGIIAIILAASKNDPASFFNIIFVKPWTSYNGLSSLANSFAILLLVSLAIAITFKYRIYNFGVSGQMLLSGIVSFVVAIALKKAGVSNRSAAILLLLIALVAGYIFGIIISLLKMYFKINEIISSILLTFIVFEGYKGLMDSSYYGNQVIPSFASLKFSLISGPLNGTNLFTWSIIIAFFLLIVIVFLFNKRLLGFKLNAAASNEQAARQARINVDKQILIVMPISAALAGVAGYFYFLADNTLLPKLSFIPQEGFYAIVISALAFYQFYLIILSTFLVTLFVRPIELHSFINLSNQALVLVLLSVFIYFLATIPFTLTFINNSFYIQTKWLKFKEKFFHKKITKKPLFVNIENYKFKVLRWKNKEKIKNKKGEE